MNVTIISGGTGNDSLVRGLKSFSKDINIKVVISAYDNGKSTGVCRAITNTLGVSDIRKNHSRLYESITEFPDRRLLEFYNKRFDLTKYRELEEVLFKLNSWGLSNLNCYAESFFSRPESKKYDYKDFSIANIIYSEMYAELGYEETNKYFCNLLNIDDFVILNSFDNVYLKANTCNGICIDDEGDLVKFADYTDKIESVHYEPKLNINLNDKAIDAVLNCDLLIISTGTFWSSIYPTLDYGNFYRYVNKSGAKKIWAINNMEDKDAYGVTSSDFIRYFENLGLDLSKFTILENKDAIETLKQPNDIYKVDIRSMGNVLGKHDGYLYAKSILSIYYGLDRDYDKYIFDFDDTIWSRNSEEDSISIHNILKINNIFGDKAMIVSGNVYTNSIKPKLYKAFGTDLSKLNIDIWADANSILYSKDEIKDVLHSSLFTDEDKEAIISCLRDRFGIECTINDYKYISNIKIKPLKELERKLLVDMLNNYLLDSIDCSSYIAYATGHTTIDIVVKSNTKADVFKHCNLKDMSTLYIGDEIDEGNDSEISKLCTNSIHTSNASETSLLLRLLEDE